MNTIPASVRSALSRALELAAGSLLPGVTSEVELEGLRVWVGWDASRKVSRFVETRSAGIRYSAFATPSGRMGKPRIAVEFWTVVVTDGADAGRVWKLEDAGNVDVARRVLRDWLKKNPRAEAIRVWDGEIADREVATFELDVTFGVWS